MESTASWPKEGRIMGEEVREKGPVSEDGVLVPRESKVEPLVSVVLPTLNEEEGIRESIERVKTGLVDAGVRGEVILSDSSTDRTPEIGRELGAHVINPDEKGYGYAYRYAFEQVRGEYVVMGDADTTYDFEELPKLLEPVFRGEADICMGSRLEGEIKDGAMPALHKYVGNPLLTAFLNTFYDTDISDAHSGFRVFHRDVLDELELGTNGMEFASEMVMEAGARDLEIAEVPITYHEREGEATLDSFRDGWRHVKFMLINAPGYLFSIPGIVMGVFGLWVMGMAYWGMPLDGISFGIHSMIAGSLLVILGYQIGSMGVMTSVAGTTIREPRDPISTWVAENVKLEHGATIGLLLLLGGSAYAGLMLAQWVATGFSSLPFLKGDVVAFTAIVLGVQTIFGSFFMSAIAGKNGV